MKVNSSLFLSGSRIKVSDMCDLTKTTFFRSHESTSAVHSCLYLISFGRQLRACVCVGCRGRGQLRCLIFHLLFCVSSFLVPLYFFPLKSGVLVCRFLFPSPVSKRFFRPSEPSGGGGAQYLVHGAVPDP